MKVNLLNQPTTPKLYKHGQVFFRSNRSMEKIPFSSQSKINILNQNKQPSTVCLVNSLHSLINEDKPIPKSYLKKIIQILSRNQIENNLLQSYGSIQDKTSQRKHFKIKRQNTQEIKQNAIFTERWLERKQTSRIRKIRTRKRLQTSTGQYKQTQNKEIQQTFYKRMTQLEQKLQQFKQVIQDKQRQIKEKQQLIINAQSQKQQAEKRIQAVLSDKLKIQNSLKSKLYVLNQQFQDTKNKLNLLKCQLLERESEITWYLLSSLEKNIAKQTT